MSVDYKWANAVMGQLKGCQAENARLREEAAAMSTAMQKVEHLGSEVARLRLTDDEYRVLREVVAWGELADQKDQGIVADLLLRHSG